MDSRAILAPLTGQALIEPGGCRRGFASRGYHASPALNVLSIGAAETRVPGRSGSPRPE